MQKALGKKGTPIPEFTIQTEYHGHYEPEHPGPKLGKYLGKLRSSGLFFSHPGCAEQAAACLSIGKHGDDVSSWVGRQTGMDRLMDKGRPTPPPS